MSEQPPFGTMVESASRVLCRCGSGAPHYHPAVKVWDGFQWHLEGTEGWQTVIEKMDADRK